MSSTKSKKNLVAAPDQTIDLHALREGLSAMPGQPAASTASKEPLGVIRGTGDVALSLGQGAAGSFKAVTDLFGADNAVSRGLGGMSEYMQGLKSQQSKDELAVSQERIRQAEESGSIGDQVGAYLQMIWDQPAEMLAQGAGSFATLGIGKLAQAGRLAQAARASGMSKEAFLATEAGKKAIEAAAEFGFKANVGVGAAQGMGAVKGSQYEQTYQNAIQQGMSPEQAKAMADQAQAYGGPGMMQQLLGAGLGGVASATGPIERIVAGKTAVKPAATMLGSVGKGFATEGATEGLQGGQERYAGNAAAIDAGVLDPSRQWTGVAGQGIQEGVLGGVLGGLAGPFEGRAATAAEPKIVPESGPLTRAANASVSPAAAQIQATEASNQALARMSSLADDEAGSQADATPPGSPADAYRAAPKPTAEQQAMADQALAAESADNEIASTSRPRPVQSPQDQEQTAQLNVRRLPSMPLEDAQRIHAEATKQGKGMALVEHPDGGYAVAPRQWVTQDMARRGQQQADMEARKAQAESAPVERAPRRRSDAVDLDPVELAIGAIEKEATPAAKAFVQEYRAGRITADEVMARGRPADPMEAIARIKPDEPAQGLILNPSGQPFKNKRAATLARERQDDPAAFEVQPVDGGFVVQPVAQAAEKPNVAEQLPGNDAGSRRTDGAAVSGTLGVVQQPAVARTDADGTADGAPASGPVDESGRGGGDDALSARWDALPEADRLPVLMSAGWHQGSVATQRMGRIKWSKMSDSQRARVGAALGAANAAPQQTPAAAGTETQQAPADQAGAPARGDAAAGAGAGVSAAGSAAVEADGVTGEKIDNEWTSFAPESGTRAIPRAEMPQIKAEHRGAMVQFLKGRNITHEQEADVDPKTLKPTQAEFSPTKVAQAKDFTGGDRAILVSADGHVLDGHHQWMAKREAGEPIRVIRLDAPIEKLIAEVREFPSSETSDGAAGKPAKKAEMRPYRRTDGGIGYEAVPIREPEVAKAPAPSANTVFTEDAAAAARARLKAKLNDGNKQRGGIDPEVFSDGVILAGYHIEKGARTFAAYAKAMLEDMGDVVKPYLKAWYMGVKFDPRGAGLEGMDSAAAVEAVDVDALSTTAADDAAPQMAQNEKTQEATNDPAASRSTPSVDQPLAQGSEPESPRRGAKQPRQRAGRGNDSGVRGARGLFEGDSDGQSPVGDGGKPDALPAGADGDLAGGLPGVSTRDYRPAPGGLKREGSWFATAARNIDLIELARRIDSEGRPATPEEQAQLAKYVGFGASEIRNNLFPVPSQWQRQQDPKRLIWPDLVREARWKPLAERMAALPEEWQRSVLQSTQYAHYTSEGVIRSVWSGLQRLGFTGGKVLEPGMGIGSFNMLMPDAVHATSTYTGLEFDGPTALIARLLSPDQHMLHDDFIKRKLPRDFFDVAVGNPPFARTPILGDPDYEKYKFFIHDFFFAKSIDRVRPGGLLVFVTSKGTMDKQSDKARKYLAERADLLGAIRLPSTAFEDNAGTSVVTDVLFLRKRAPGQAPAGPAWQGVQTIDTKDGQVAVNEYFAANPDMVLGEQRISGNVDDFGRRINSNGMGGAKYTVVSYDTTAEQLDERFAKAIERLPENVYSPLSANSEQVKRETAKVDFDPSIKREGVVYLGDDGKLRRVQNGVGVVLTEGVKLSAKDEAWFKGYVGVRDMVQAARQAQAQDGNWEAALKSLNKAYDAFRKEHGPINDFRTQTRKSIDDDGNEVTTEIRIFKNRRLFREDYDSAVMTQLEVINEAGEIVKAPFLLGRTIGKPVTRTVKTAGDALAVSLDEIGRLDLDDIARRMSLQREEVIDALGSQVFKTPGGQWQLSDEYLSGDVVAKLEEAELAARIDPSLKRNIEALKAVQPEKLGPSQISVKAGASWVPVEYVNEFAKEIGAGPVTFDPKTESWQVQGGNERKGRRAGAEYGTADRSAAELLEAVLNSQSITIKRTDADKKTYTDTAATTAANEMARKIKDKFKGWIWTDTDRASNLVEIYNKRFNNIAPRRFDGSHMTLPGVSLRFSLHPHQKRAIWRQVQTGNTYLAHAVGAGKTIEMIAGGMEQKRLGLINKPIYAVPNHMLEQFANEFMELYPLANIMVADDENFSAERRKAFVAAATLNAPDAIVITHSAFERIGVKEEAVAPIRDEILDDLNTELDDSDKGDRVRRSQLQQQIEAVTQRFDSIAGVGKKDSTIKFEDIGADFIYVDEAHAFRKLDFTTNQKIKGIDPNGSRRALDMYVKSRHLERQRPGRAMVFASGTPVTNTMGELYTIMRFFAPDELSRAGISTFDAWARQFGEAVPALEANAAGRYEVVERFAKFDNVPELMSRVRQFMDVLTSEHLGALVKRPDIEGGKPDLITVDATDALKSYMKGVLLPRLEASRKWKPSKDQPFNPDPVIAITSDGRFAALDPRFVGEKIDEDKTPTKLTRMADEVARIYEASAGNEYLDKQGKPESVKGSTQIVFYNLGFGEQSMRNRGFDARGALTKRLISKGVKREHILWFDDADTDAKKETMFKAMRNGQARVLIGSAKKMGTGVNVQKRLLALHYFDPPWYPSDVEQPHGRIIRQGNQNSLATIKWYATKGTYDATMWQMVARKQRFIDQAFSGDKSLRSMDDMSEASMFEQAAAVASGDPRALQLAGLRQDVERLERLQAAHHSEQIAVRSGLKGAEWNIESYAKRVATYSDAFKAIGGSYYSFTTAKVSAKSFDKLGEFGQALKDAFNQGAADAVMAPDTKARELATLPPGITIRMEAGEDREGKPTGAHELVLRAGAMDISLTEYTPSLGEKVDPVGLGRRVINAINGIEAELSRAKTAKASEETDATRLRKKLGAPFEYQQELAEKIGDLKRLEEELRAEGEAEAAAAAAEVRIDETGASESDSAEGAAKFSRSRSTPAGVTLRDARAAADLIRSELPNAPEIIVVDSLADVPADLQNEIRNRAAEFDWEAAYHSDGKIYAMAQHFDSLDRFMFVVGRHEVRHAGFDAMLGERKDEVLLSIGRANRWVMLEARKLMADKTANSFTEGVEEALADMPVEEVAALSRIKVMVAAIRRWLRTTAHKLRKAGWNKLADSIEPKKWTDNDVIAFVMKAENVSRAPVGIAGGSQFSRAGRAQVTTNDEGRPEFVYGDTKLAFPIPTERIEVIPGPGQSVMQYAIMPTDGFDVLGHVDLLMENGRPVSLLDIEAYKRGNGSGRKVIETLLRAYPDADLNISNIVPEAQGFWERMGVPVQNLEEGAAYDGTLNLETFLQAKNEGGAQANPRRAGEANRRFDTRAAQSAFGTDQGWSVASRFSRPRALRTLRDAGARSAEAARDANLFAGYKVGDFIASSGKLSWWDKSIGTPFNLAKRHPGTFGRVFNAVQDFLSDVSFYATEAANLAPKLLPKLETLKDLTKQAISPADNKAISAPIFEGTLTWTRDKAGKPITMEQAEALAEKLTAEQKANELLGANLLDPKVLRMWKGLPLEQYEAAVSSRYESQLLRPGVVWSDAELRSKYSLTDEQIGLYKEFRAAVDRSLDDLAVSEIARLVRSKLPGMKQAEGQSADDFAMQVRDALYEIGENDLGDTAATLANKVKDLKARGYAPLSRFGHHTLDVVQDGERVYFGMFESQAEANRMARKMAEQFPGAQISQGTQSTEAYKMLAGVSPETIELFGEILGLDAAGDDAADKAFQAYLKKAKSTRSAMKRLIHRKGIDGFSEDAGRVLAGFVTSNARRTASNHHLKGIMESVEAMPKEQGELKDYAAKMAEYVNNPVEEAQALRGLMFAQYLGGSVASALVNMTQPIAVTMPFLSQHTTAAKAAKAVTQAFADMASKKKLEQGLADALALAEDKGIVAPQEIHYLQAQARGAGSLVSGDGTKAGDAAARVQNGVSKLSVAWGKLFGFAELVNRRATFIAAYRVAVDKGNSDPFKFAADAVEETQFVYNKGNRPQWARGAIGATLFTFKTYSISYVELLSRMWKQGGPEGKRAFALALAVMVLMSGVDELPFMEDAEDLIDGFAQKVLGLNWQTKLQRNEFMAGVLGKDLADFLGKGVSGVPGVPIDVSGRLGMGNLIPGTGLLRADSTSAGRDVAEIAGPVADLIKRAGSAVGMAAQGDIGKAALEVSPTAIRNVAKAADMAEMGMYRDSTGKNVIQTTPGEALLKGIGFQPNTVAKVQEATATKQRMIALNKKVEGEIADLWAKGRFESDPAKVERARNRLREWNRDNPDSPIKIDAGQIHKRVKAMRATKQERIEKTAPKELRASLRQELVD